MKKMLLKIRLKIERSLIKKNMELRHEIKRLNKILEETKKQNHQLIDQKTLDNIKIRELTLGANKWMTK